MFSYSLDWYDLYHFCSLPIFCLFVTYPLKVVHRESYNSHGEVETHLFALNVKLTSMEYIYNISWIIHKTVCMMHCKNNSFEPLLILVVTIILVAVKLAVNEIWEIKIEIKYRQI